MIRIARAAAPSELGAVRTARLSAARAALASGETIRFVEYDIVKPQLTAMQHRKCCYCEKREEQAKYRDVEHYRPKWRYWWLAWTWENLLFSCIDCNREHKRDEFSLSPGGVQLVAQQVPPGSERPLVIDPADPAADPTSEIEFRRALISGVETWIPFGTTARGRKTIEVCGLDRPGLLDLYREHVKGVVRPRAEPVLDAHRSHDTRAVHEAWSTAKRFLLQPEREFRGLSYDALRALVSEALRDHYRLQLTPP